jgi:hypothetical protein
MNNSFISNENILYIYDQIINITKLNLNNSKKNNLINIIKLNTMNLYNQNLKYPLNELNAIVLNDVTNMLKKKSINNNINQYFKNDKNLNVDMLDYAKSQYTNIPDNNPYSQWDNRPLNTKDMNINMKDISQYKKERDSLFYNNKPDDIDFRDKNYISKKTDKEVYNNNNNNVKSELDKFFESDNNNNNNELDNFYKDHTNEIKIDNTKKYDDDNINDKFEKLQKERKLSFENTNNNNNNKNNNNNNNNNKNIIEEFTINNDKSDISEIHELLTLCVSKIE